VAIVLVVVGIGSDGDDTVLDEPVRTSTSTTSTSTTSTTATTSTSVVDSSSTTEPSPTTVATSMTTTTEVITAETRCMTATGEGEAPLTVEACIVDRARVGETVTVQLRASDDDAQIRDDCGSPWVDWGESTNDPTCTIGCAPSAAPSPPSSVETTREHVYRAPGRYPIRAVVESNCGAEPGGQIVSAMLTIEIT
jgi:hypothetical protein